MAKSVTEKKSEQVEYIKLIVKIIFFGFVAAVLYHFFYQGHVLKKPYPENTFLCIQFDRFNDFHNVVEWCRHLNPYFEPYVNGNSNYLPLANLFFWFSSLFQKGVSLTIFWITLSVIFYWLSYNAMPKSEKSIDRHKNAFVLSFLNYGYLFCLDRGNSELFNVVSIAAFLFFYQKDKQQLAMLCLALSIATKIYPALFIILYVSDKKYRQAALTAIYSVILVLVPIYFQKGAYLENLYYILNGFEVDFNTTFFTGAFGDNNTQMVTGSSLFCVLKILNIKMSLGITNMLGKYFVLVAIIAAFVIFYTIFVEKELWRKVTLLTSIIIALPHISFDYKLFHLVYCVCLFINCGFSKTKAQINYRRIAIIFGLLLIPKSYYFFKGITSTTTLTSDVPISSVLNPLLLLYVCFLICSSGLRFYYKDIPFKQLFAEHFLQIRKSILYLLPLLLLIFPYISFSKTAKTKYKSFKEHNFKAKDLQAANKKEEAIVELQQAFKERPFRYKVPMEIAGIYSGMGKLDSAMIYYKKTLAIAPGDMQVTYAMLILDINFSNGKAMEALNKKDFKKAAPLFEKVLTTFYQIPPNQDNQGFLAGLYTNLSVCYMNLQKWPDAKRVMDQLAGIDPQNQFLQTNLPTVNKMLTAN